MRRPHAATAALLALVAIATLPAPRLTAQEPDAGPTRTAGPAAEVEGHTLTVTSWPPVAIELDTAFAHIGSRTFALYDVAAAETHVFVDAGPDRVVDRLYWVQVEEALPESDHRYDYSRLPRSFARAGLDFVADTRFGPGYSLDSVDREGDTAEVLRLLASAGYRMPAEMMRIRMVTLDDERRREILVIYLEDLARQDLSIAVLDAAGSAAWRRIADRLQERAVNGMRIVRTDHAGPSAGGAEGLAGEPVAGHPAGEPAAGEPAAGEPATAEAESPAAPAADPPPAAPVVDPTPAAPVVDPTPAAPVVDPTPAAAIERPELGAFAFEHVLTIAAPPDSVWGAITGDLTGWWDHTFSGDPARFFLEPWPGGRFIELFEDGSRDGFLHGTVTFAKRPETLRFEGPLGLTGYAVHGVYTYTLEPVDQGTRLTMSVRMAGEMGEGWPEAVEGVWRHFLFERLKPFVEGALE